MAMTQAKELVREALERMSDEEAEQIPAHIREIEGQRDRAAIRQRSEVPRALAGSATIPPL
jgi:hypothetical protein